MVGTVLGRRDRPHLLEAWGSRFNVQLEPNLALFRYRDQPGMLGRVGIALGDAGVNIVSAAVGRRPAAESDSEAIMIVTADAPVPQPVSTRSWPARTSSPPAPSVSARTFACARWPSTRPWCPG